MKLGIRRNDGHKSTRAIRLFISRCGTKYRRRRQHTHVSREIMNEWVNGETHVVWARDKDGFFAERKLADAYIVGKMYEESVFIE